jgi:hypothetical protein
VPFPLPTDKDVCLRTITEERLDGEKVVDRYVIKVMCRAASEGAKSEKSKEAEKTTGSGTREKPGQKAEPAAKRVAPPKEKTP